ncbi:MAG: MFS transporter [Clostridia bacterium]|nr:MFS transporter [Clostridia bacterium]
MGKRKNNILRFSLCHISFLIFFTIPYVFINTFLLSFSNDSEIHITVIYNIVTFICTPIAMHFASMVSKHMPIKRIAQIGVMLYCADYAILVIFKEKVLEFYPVIGILMGCAAGFYWLCYNIMLDILLDDDNRDKVIGLLTVAYCIITLAAPLLSGWFISNMEGSSGYIAVFIFSFVVAIITMFLLGFLPDSRGQKVKNPFKTAYRGVRENKSWRSALIASLFMGIREGAIQFILAIMVFKLVDDEFLVGVNTFAAGLGAVISSLLISFLVKPKNRIKFMTVAVSALMVCAVLFVYFSVNKLSFISFAEIIIIFSVIDGFLQKFITNPVTSIVYYSLDTFDNLADYRNEYLTCREVFLDAGRAIGAVLFLLLPGGIVYMTAGVLIMTAVQYLTILYCKRTLSVNGK